MSTRVRPTPPPRPALPSGAELKAGDWVLLEYADRVVRGVVESVEFNDRCGEWHLLLVKRDGTHAGIHWSQVKWVLLID